MIEVHIVRDSKGSIWQFTVKGHAGFAEKGSDIVCAAVSAVAYTAVGALDELVNIRNYIEKDGYMKCTIPTGLDEERRYKAQVVLEAMAIGFKQIQDAYNDYIEVLDEEV